VTQHNLRGCGTHIHNVSGRWSCKYVYGGHQCTHFVWQGHLLHLTEDRGQSIKLDGNHGPRPGIWQDEFNNESIWDLWVMVRRASSLSPLAHNTLLVDVAPFQSCLHSSSFSDGLCSALYFQLTVSWPCSKKTRPWKKYLDSHCRGISLLCFHLISFPHHSRIHIYQVAK